MPTTSERKEHILASLKTDPYFAVRIVPLTPIERLTHEALLRNVEASTVSLRGWSLPYVDSRTLISESSYIGELVTFERHVEMWRAYRDGQFVYLGALWDVFRDLQERNLNEFKVSINAPPEVKKTVRGAMSYVNLIYSVTEFYLFCARFSSSLGMTKFRFEIALRNVEDWALVNGQQSIFSSFYQTRGNDIRLTQPPSNSFLTEETSVNAARDALVELFSCFNWRGTSSMIASWQKALLTGKYYL